MSNSTTAKKRQRSPALTAGIVLLFIGIIAMLSLAMFASYDNVTNVFNAITLDIVLIEPDWNPDDGQNVVPNEEIPKNPKIVNNDAADAYVFLRVTVPYDDMTIDDNNSEKGKKVFEGELPYYKFVITDENNEKLYSTSFDNVQLYNKGWLPITGYPKVDTTNKTYTYLYAHVGDDDKLIPLISGATTATALFDEIYVMNFREIDADPEHGITEFPNYNRDVSIKVEAFGIQTGYLPVEAGKEDDPDAIWAVFESLN